MRVVRTPVKKSPSKAASRASRARSQVSRSSPGGISVNLIVSGYPAPFYVDSRNRTRWEDDVRKRPATQKPPHHVQRHEGLEPDREQSTVRTDRRLSRLAGGWSGIPDCPVRMGNGILRPRHLSGRASRTPRL